MDGGSKCDFPLPHDTTRLHPRTAKGAPIQTQA